MLSALCLLAAAKYDVPVLDLACTLVPAESRLSVSCTVDIPANFIKAGQAEFQLGDQMSVPKVHLGERELVPKQTSKVDHDITYTLALPSANGSTRVEISYESTGTKGMVFLLSPQECFGGGYNTVWFPAFGSSRRAMGVLKFLTPKKFLVKASGREIKSDVSDEIRTTEFHVENPIVPTFASAPFHVVKVPGKVPVTMYFLSPRPDLEMSFANGCASILKVLDKEFGTYPFPDFSIIETPSPISSMELGFFGASYEGFMFADQRSVDGGFNLAYFGHEMSHQWWGNLVQMDGDGETIFSEGLAQYGSLQAVRQIDGVEMANLYRLEGYPGYSNWQCMMGALAFRETGYENALSYQPKENSPVQHDMADTKGFLAWETIARIMGKDAFRSGLRQVASEYGWRSLTWEQFWKVLQSKSKVDLKPYRAQWFDQKGFPTVWTDWKEEGESVRVTLHQSLPTYRLQMPLVVRFKDGTSMQREVEFSTVSHEIQVDAKKDVLSIELDPDHETLHSTPELDEKMRDWKDFAQLDFVNRMIKNPPNAEKLALDALTRLPSPDKYGTEFLLRFTLAGIYRGANKNAEAKEQLERALASPVRNNDFVPLAFLRLARVNDALGNKEEVARCLRAMIDADAALKYPSGAIVQAKRLFPDFKY